VQKQAPSFLRLALMTLFALSCFGILTFLWVSFGGSVPLKSKQYQVKVDFPEATTLAEQADVRISGVKVGKVQKKQLNGRYTQAVLNIENRYAPIPADSQAVLRAKTLLGETYVELSPGDKNGPTVADGGRLSQGNVADTVQLDEIFRAFDPKTKAAFRIWLDQQGRGFRNRGRDLNSALGNLAPFEQDATTILAILDEQKGDVRRLVSNTGVVFDALTERDGQLRSLIQNSNRVFATTASRNEKLQEIFTVFPTFLDESRETTTRVTRFANNTNPLITQLRPAARELSPTLVELRSLAPDLKGLFRDLDPLITAAKRGLPATEQILDDTIPLLRQLDPFLRNLNPMLDWIGLYKKEVVSFFALDAASTQAVDRPAGSSQSVHYLRTANPLNPENLAAYPFRVSTNRSNPYLEPGGAGNYPYKVFGTYLCTNNPIPALQPGGQEPTLPGSIGELVPGLPEPVAQLLPQQLRDQIQSAALVGAAPPCVEQAPLGRFLNQPGKYPHVTAAPER
jgi:phospholipid/cholesterol/gamma-HCH transport system substrate-binding protein